MATATSAELMSRMRPVRPGCSVGGLPQSSRLTAGTLGAIVTDRSGDLYLLTNQHVIASGDDTLPQVVPGANVFQPAMLHDAGGDANRVAAADRAVPLSEDGTNLVDCALARLLDRSHAAREILQIGRRPGPAAAARTGMIVEKMGARTGRTQGKIVRIGAALDIMVGVLPLRFADQIVIEPVGRGPFAETGDSGALVLDQRTGATVGLLCGGSTLNGKPVAVANPIDTVLKQLHITL